MGDTEKDDDVAAENWDDEGGHLAAQRRKSRWDQATGEHWYGYAPTAETPARRDAEIERDQQPPATREP
ncbi:hypothetical protein OVA26_16860 [Microbacterium sp. SL62]|uniref:hypothetical protein n=1 Tax=Microbacterium sp. SL62 TaxID=2995139 RepID=UPI0022741599|nr:hypothetical protein [Microbacterium sp. SL62]MCY1718610.1 hypothetical protein [Microbacterium sp. SL62]